MYKMKTTLVWNSLIYESADVLSLLRINPSNHTDWLDWLTVDYFSCCYYYCCRRLTRMASHRIAGWHARWLEFMGARARAQSKRGSNSMSLIVCSMHCIALHCMAMAWQGTVVVINIRKSWNMSVPGNKFTFFAYHPFKNYVNLGSYILLIP